jgi:hypothetical protein
LSDPHNIGIQLSRDEASFVERYRTRYADTGKNRRSDGKQEIVCTIAELQTWEAIIEGGGGAPAGLLEKFQAAQRFLWQSRVLPDIERQWRELGLGLNGQKLPLASVSASA